MKKILVIAIVCLLGSFAAAAQTVKVNGTIVDEQNRPVEFVNVALISLPDSSFVTESTTDGKGKFALRATAGSDFLLRLSYIGYVGEQIVIRTPQGTVQMGDIILKEQSVALDEVVISGSNITQKVDRMVVVPTATAMKNSYNPYDLMLNLAIPHLKVDALGKGLEANGGSVQTRINGIVATSTEVAALLPKEIVREVEIVGKVIVLVVKPLLHTMYRLIFQHICLIYIRIRFLEVTGRQVIEQSPL